MPNANPTKAKVRIIDIIENNNITFFIELLEIDPV